MTTQSLVRIHALTKQFLADTTPFTALEDISLTVRSGEFLAIVGSSGCGKSTLLRLLAGLDDDYIGEIDLKGSPLQGTGRDRSMVFQEHRLFPWLTVNQNIVLGLARSHLTLPQKQQCAEEHIALVGLTGFENAYPHQLSGGMAQRVAIARGLVANPDILLLDEPFGALDALTRRNMQEELLRIRRQTGTTMILVTHDVDEAVFLADRVVVMKSRPGRIEQVVDVALPYPRSRACEMFQATSNELIAQLTHTPTAPPSPAYH